MSIDYRGRHRLEDCQIGYKNLHTGLWHRFSLENYHEIQSKYVGVIMNKPGLSWWKRMFR